MKRQMKVTNNYYKKKHPNINILKMTFLILTISYIQI